MSQKLEFVDKAIRPGANVSALCVEFGISRQTGHKWLRRYRAQGYAGLVDHSRRPASSPLATAEEVVVSIVELRDKHPSWGAQKLGRVLARRLGPSTPSPSTIARVLRRLGKMKRKRFPVRVWTVEAREPNVQPGQALHWRLVTTAPVRTLEEARERLVRDHDRAVAAQPGDREPQRIECRRRCIGARIAARHEPL